VVTSTLVFEGEGGVGEYVGGYSDWVRQRPAPVVATPSVKRAAAPTPASAPRAERKRRLTFKEQHELKALPERIEALEGERATVYASLSDPALVRDGAAMAVAAARLAELDAAIEAATERWVELETIAAEG
jgi:ATP-binding cassette subfamily F protein uup